MSVVSECSDELVDDVAVVLVDVALDLLGEGIDGLVGPPLLDASRAVVLPALVVEAVGDLVAHDDADGAVVEVARVALAEEGRLQDAGGEGWWGRKCTRNEVSSTRKMIFIGEGDALHSSLLFSKSGKCELLTNGVVARGVEGVHDGGLSDPSVGEEK